MSKEQQELVSKIKILLKKQYGESSMTAMRKLFDSYDKNGDEAISEKELGQLLKDAGVGNRLTRSFWIDGIMKSLDESGDKKIDWDEFSKAVQ